MEPSSVRMPEVQTTIDECSDDCWEGVLYVGSNFICRIHAESFLRCAALLDIQMRQTEKAYAHDSAHESPEKP